MTEGALVMVAGICGIDAADFPVELAVGKPVWAITTRGANASDAISELIFMKFLLETLIIPSYTPLILVILLWTLFTFLYQLNY